jgi:hypothetical protein
MAYAKALLGLNSKYLKLLTKKDLKQQDLTILAVPHPQTPVYALTPRTASEQNALTITLISLDRLPTDASLVVLYTYLDGFFVYKSKCY